MRKTAKKLNAVGKTETDQPKKVPIKEAKIELEKMQAERADELIKNTRFF